MEEGQTLEGREGGREGCERDEHKRRCCVVSDHSGLPPKKEQSYPAKKSQSLPLHCP